MTEKEKGKVESHVAGSGEEAEDVGVGVCRPYLCKFAFVMVPESR